MQMCPFEFVHLPFSIQRAAEGRVCVAANCPFLLAFLPVYQSTPRVRVTLCSSLAIIPLSHPPSSRAWQQVSSPCAPSLQQLLTSVSISLSLSLSPFHPSLLSFNCFPASLFFTPIISSTSLMSSILFVIRDSPLILLLLPFNPQASFRCQLHRAVVFR